MVLAKETNFIDLIIGGHTHTFLNNPVSVTNKMGKDVLVNQVGYAGIMLGRLDYQFASKGSKKIINSTPITVTKI